MIPEELQRIITALTNAGELLKSAVNGQTIPLDQLKTMINDQGRALKVISDYVDHELKRLNEEAKEYERRIKQVK